MLALWITLAGGVIYVVSSFLVWVRIIEYDCSMWNLLVGTLQTNIWNMLLWLTPICVAAILILTLQQLFRRRITKGSALSMFILSIASLLPLGERIARHCSTIPMVNRIPLEFEGGFFLTLLGLFTIVVGTTLGLFGKKRS